MMISTNLSTAVFGADSARDEAAPGRRPRRWATFVAGSRATVWLARPGMWSAGSANESATSGQDDDHLPQRLANTTHHVGGHMRGLSAGDSLPANQPGHGNG